MKLIWHGPYSFRNILADDSIRDQFTIPGVYVWFEILPTGKRQLCYVGKATRSTTLWGRHLQHYASLVGGLYRIPKEYGDWEKDWVPDWRNKIVSDTMLDQDKFACIVNAGFKRASAIEIYFCPIKGDMNLSLLERQLLFALKPTGTKRGTLSIPADNIDISHLNAPW